MSVLRRLGGRRGRSSPVVLVIGGGATGTGIAAEAARRGYKVTLVERGELGCGTSGHFHGILHSGGRYAVNDPATAAECYQENQLLRSLIPSAILDTHGMFVALAPADAAHGDIWLQACLRAGIPAAEIPVSEALKREPNLSPRILRAFTVPDGFISGTEVLRLNRQAAETAAVPATIMEHTAVTGLYCRGGRIVSADLRDTRTEAGRTLKCDYVINAGGVWAGRVAALADIPLHMVFDKGTMIHFKDDVTHSLINHLHPEGDGDMLVPSGHGSIMGTTARVIDDPDDCLPTQEEVDVLMAEGSAMVPILQRTEAIRVYAGVRPLFTGTGADAPAATPGNTRAISRSYKVLDHSSEGLDNFISVVGGKVTIYRRMAAAAVDMLEIKSGRSIKPAQKTKRPAPNRAGV